MEVDLRRLLGEASTRPDRHGRAPVAVAQNIAVVGNTGSGKTTFARRLAHALDVPHVELDALFWRPGWEMAPTDEFRAAAERATSAGGWVADGNYFGRLGDRLLREADVVVWLDPPLRTIMVRLVRRAIARVRGRESLWGTNRETWRGAFLSRDSLFVWALKMHFRKRAERSELIMRFPHVRLRSSREAEEWLQRYVTVRM